MNRSNAQVSPSSPAPSPGSKRRLVFSNYDSLQNPYYGGGGARAIHELARRLHPSWDVRVVTGRYPGSRPEALDGVRYERIGAAHAGPYLGQLLYQFLLPWRAARGDFDVWIESLTPPFSTACLPWFTRRPVVALTQVLAGAAMGRKYHLPFAALERLGLRTYRHAIVLSSHLQTVVRQANPRLRTVVIPNGVERALIDRPVARQDHHLLFLGRIDVEQKGLDLLLNALQPVAARLPVPLLIAGGGPPAQVEFLQRRIQALNLADRVHLIGRADDAQKNDLLDRAALMLMPSRFEASPLVLIEAFCHAVPLVMFDIPELSDFPADCCVKVPPFDLPSFGAAVVSLLADRDRRETIGQAAKQFARKFDWDDLARQYGAFLEGTLAGAPAARKPPPAADR